MSEKLDALLEAYLAKQLEVPAVVEPVAPVAAAEPQYVTLEAMKGLMAEFSAAVSKEIAESAPVGREEGAGRVGGLVNAESEIEANPVDYLAAKAARGEQFTDEEKDLAWALTKAVLANGLIYGE
jgi:hypothetical protein